LAWRSGDLLLMQGHADALAEGEAAGATIYTLDDEATDEAAQALAERHDRDDLLSGVDLTAQDDLVATVLIDIARTETEPRIERLAKALEAAIKGEGLRMHPRPHQTGGFSVLKSPDIPSALVELGFLSSARDLARLTDPAWRAKMSMALREGLKAWADEDAQEGDWLCGRIAEAAGEGIVGLGKGSKTSTTEVGEAALLASWACASSRLIHAWCLSWSLRWYSDGMLDSSLLPRFATRPCHGNATGTQIGDSFM
jgi:hypothetical protein